MLTHKAFKYRLYPTPAQVVTLTSWLDLNRELYNAALQERRDAWQMAHKPLSLYDQQKELPAVRAVRPEYQAIPIAVLRGTLQRLDRAFKAFFRRVKAGQTPGYPRFQGKRRFNSFIYNDINTLLHLTERTVTLCMFGVVRVKFHRPLEGAPKAITVQRDGDHWYIYFSCEVDIAPLPPTDTVVGLDLGVTHFATLSTGDTIANPRYLRRSLAKLKAAQQQLSRCKRGSHRRDRARRQLARLYGKIRNQRADFCHQTARRLVNSYGTVVLEDLQTANLSKRPAPRPQEDGSFAPNGAAAKAGLNQSILDASWGLFADLVRVKAAWAGRAAVFVDPRYTSQTCSGCGQVRKKELSERWHSCECGTSLDRDHNAAINILRLGSSLRASGKAHS